MRLVRFASAIAAAVAIAAVTPASALARRHLPSAPFRVGAAVVDINPTVTTYAAGFGASPPIAPGHVAGPALTVRALYISNGQSAVELASVDSQAEFAAYQEGAQYGLTIVRADAAAAIDAAGLGPRIGPQDIIVQATHGHATPTLEGLWGPVPPAYLRQVTAAEKLALVRAAARAQPAELRFGTADASSLDDVTLAQYDAFPGWADDPLLTVLWAVSPRTGATIATYATVPAHADIVCGQCLKLEHADYPGLVRAALERQLGGKAIVGAGTVGREETPVQATSIADDELFAAETTSLIDGALAASKPLGSDRIGGTQRFIDIPGTEPLLLSLVEANHLSDAQKEQFEQASGEYPLDRADTPPYQDGVVAGTWVTALRLGGVAYVSMPGEPFPEIRQELAQATTSATVVALSKGQDDLGYFYPSYVTPFSEFYPSDTYTNSASAQTGDQVLSGQDANLRALGFTTAQTLPTPLPVDATQTVRPGLQAIGGPFTVDAGPDGVARVPLMAIFSPPGLPQGELDYGLPTGSVPVANQAVGSVRWSFDPGSAASGYHNFGGSDVAPVVITPAFSVGRHAVGASIDDANGQTATTSLVITVYPALRARIEVVRHGRSAVVRARVRGGDGRELAYRWRIGAASAAGPTVRVRLAGQRVTLVVTDGTGAQVEARDSLGSPTS